MPPNLDVYVISPARNRETIERFLHAYVDWAASEDRGTEELPMVALDSSGQPSSDDLWDWEPSKSLTHIVERALEFPRRAFAAHLKTLDTSLTGGILAFDVENRVIFGLSIDDEGGKAENLERGKALLDEMAQKLGRLTVSSVWKSHHRCGEQSNHLPRFWCMHGQTAFPSI
jgi:hypothetical protein